MLLMETKKTIGEFQISIKTTNPSIARGREESVNDIVGGMSNVQRDILGHCIGEALQNPNYTYQSTIRDPTYLYHIESHVFLVVQSFSDKQLTVMKFLMDEAHKTRRGDA